MLASKLVHDSLYNVVQHNDTPLAGWFGLHGEIDH
jgi:hypothetical protein